MILIIITKYICVEIYNHYENNNRNDSHKMDYDSYDYSDHIMLQHPDKIWVEINDHYQINGDDYIDNNDNGNSTDIPHICGIFVRKHVWK